MHRQRRRSKKCGLTLLEMSLSTGITAVVVGAAAAVTLVCARLGKSATAMTASGFSAAEGLQTILEDVGRAEAVLTSQTISGIGTSDGGAVKSDGKCLVLRLPYVDAAGRPLPGATDVVWYQIGSNGGKRGKKGDKWIVRGSAEFINSVFVPGSLKYDYVAQADKLEFKYLGKSAKSGGPVKTTLATLGSLADGVFDGAIDVDPTAVLVKPNVAGAGFVKVMVEAHEGKEKRELSSAAKLRNSSL